MIDNLPLHSNTKKQLKNIALQPGHAYLFHGPDSSGKKAAALSLAAQLAAGKTSPAAIKLIAAGKHEHVSFVSPQDGKGIKISQIKELIHDLSMKAFESDLPRFIIVDEAQSMSTEAGNACLKILEEPPEGTIIFLLASSPSQILPTITSRTFAVAFLPVKKSELKKYLTGMGIEEGRAADIIELSDGRPGLARQIALDETSYQKYTAIDGLASNFLDGTLTTRFKIAQTVATTTEIGLFLASIMKKIRHSFLGTSEGEGRLRKIFAAERYLKHNLNPRLVIEYLALEI